MTADEQIGHMVQELSNAALTRYFVGEREARVSGDLHPSNEPSFHGGRLRRQKDSIAAEWLDKAFGLNYLLNDFHRWLITPAFVLIVDNGAGTGRESTHRFARYGHRQATPNAQAPSKPTRSQMCGAWERRMLAGLIDAFSKECDGTLLDPVIPSTRVAQAGIELFRKRWHQMGQSVMAALLKSGAYSPTAMQAHGCSLLAQVLHEQASRILGKLRETVDPQMIIDEGRKALANHGNAGSVILRRAWQWHSDWHRSIGSYWARGETLSLNATLEPWELYAAWIELRINESKSRIRRPQSWQVLGRLRGDPPDCFYNCAGEYQSIGSHSKGPFPPDARLVLVEEQEHSEFRRIWVQAEWEPAAVIRERQAFLTLQAINLECDELVILTPCMDTRVAMSADGTEQFVTHDLRLPIRVLPFVPDPTAVQVNAASVLALFDSRPAR